VAIPEILALYNEYFLKDEDRQVIDKYMETIPPENRVTQCAKCGQCEDLCPQQIPIRNVLGGVSFRFEKTLQSSHDRLRSQFKEVD
jgi:predicted aldo/keto reductase-like oxidoreductase